MDFQRKEKGRGVEREGKGCGLPMEREWKGCGLPTEGKGKGYKGRDVNCCLAACSKLAPSNPVVEFKVCASEVVFLVKIFGQATSSNNN